MQGLKSVSVSLDVLEAFEAAILDFPGPVIAVSHDRRFIERFGGEVWELTAGQIVVHAAGSAVLLRAVAWAEAPDTNGYGLAQNR